MFRITFWRRLTASSSLGAWLLLAAWALIILVLVTQPDIGEAGGRRLRIGGPALAHAAFFGVLGFLTANASLPLAIPRGRWWILVALTLYGIACELIQASVPGRTPSLVDLGGDVVGAYVGMVVWLVLARWSSRMTMETALARTGSLGPDAAAPPTNDTGYVVTNG